jgi:hypothetical protein
VRPFETSCKPAISCLNQWSVLTRLLERAAHYQAMVVRASIVVWLDS